MIKKILTILLSFNLLVLSQYANACSWHRYFNPNQNSLMSRAALKLAEPEPAQAVFKLKHAPMTKVAPGSEHEIVVEYERPLSSDAVSLALTSTTGIQLSDETIELKDYEGSFKVRFSLETGSYNSITMKVSGKNNGQDVNRSSVIYIRTKSNQVNG